MKTFKSILSAALICFSTTTGYSQEQRAGLRLIPKTSTENFMQYFERMGEVIENAKENSSDVNRDSRLQNFSEKFKRICGDRDYEDEIISNQSTTNAVNITFTCYENNSLTEGTAFNFDLDEDAKLMNFSEVLIKNNGVAEDKKKLINLVFRETVALVAATSVSVLAAKAMMPGQSDKPKHAGVSAVMGSLITSAAYHFFKVSPKKAGVIGFSVCLLVGAAKEMYDKRHPERHDAEMKDFGADAVGCAAGAGFVTYAISW